MTLVKRAERYGFLKRACPECAQRMVVARSGKTCLNCPAPAVPRAAWKGQRP